MKPLGVMNLEGGGAVALPGVPWISNGGQIPGFREWALPTSLEARPRSFRLERARTSAITAAFNELADTWHRETQLYSLPERKAMHPAYQRIIGMGREALPLILERLNSDGPNHWFWALAAITGEDPAAGTHTLEDATAAWLAWAREQPDVAA